MDKSEKTILLVFLVVLVVLCCILAACGGSLLLITNSTFFREPTLTSAPPTEVVIVPAPTTETLAPTPRPTQVQVDTDTLSTLESAFIPSADLIYLAERYEGKVAIPSQLSSVPPEYQLGDKLDFYKLNVDTNQTESVTAVLRYKSDTVYFWAQEGIELDDADLRQVMKTFSDKIYPTNQEFFGKEWIPGVDNDPHLYIFFGKDMGFDLAGYHAPSDGVIPLAHKYSNTHEMFYMNSDVLDLWDEYTLSVMAHEFQHLIHGFHDPNEELWINEGFSELATLLNGYDTGGFDSSYTYDTDIQLNTWSVGDESDYPHYGASFLYVAYMLDRFGDDFTKAVVASQLNGFTSIDEILTRDQVTDPATGKLITADDFFVDWTIANYFNDPSIGDGRYAYHIYSSAPTARTTETVTQCANVDLNRTVKQYGVDYIELDCEGGSVDLQFSGASSVSVLPLPSSDGRFMWSNRADTSVMKLSREFDFSQVSGPITLFYRTWYDLETDYDYVYLLASTDGQNWEIVNTPSCTSYDPSGNSYGCGYNDNSRGWITEDVDLSKYAGSKVTLSFEYITDAAVNGEGFVIDDVAVSAIDYAADFNDDDGGWLAEGFVRIDNLIPQSFMVSILNPGDPQPVQKYVLTDGESLDITLPPLPRGQKYTLVVSGSTRFTRQPASYLIHLKQE